MIAIKRSWSLEGKSFLQPCSARLPVTTIPGPGLRGKKGTLLKQIYSYIDELHQKIASLQQNGESIDPSPLSPDYAEDRSPGSYFRCFAHVFQCSFIAGLKHDSPHLSRSSIQDHEEANQLHQEIEDPASGLTNPLSTGPPAFMSADNGRTCTPASHPLMIAKILIPLIVYLGTSSNWSFARRVLSLTHEHIYQEALPTGALIFDGATYDLGWDGLRRSHSLAEPPAVPTYDHALYLINVVKFRCGQLYHLFDENEFMSNLQEFYSEPKPNATTGLWYVHFLLILAFGKGFVKHKVQGNRPPGADYFVKALEMLPDVIVLHEEPIESAEVMCCIALYLQALDCRSSAHNYVSYQIGTRGFESGIYRLTHDSADRSGHANGHGGGNAYADADRVSRREYGSAVSQDLVDSIHPGSRDDLVDGSSPDPK